MMGSMALFTVQVLAWVSCCRCCNVDLPRFEIQPNIITPLFKKLQCYGQTKKVRTQQENQRHSALKQFVVITVVSYEEIQNSFSWHEIPANIQRKRLNFTVNRLTEMHNPNEHGEMWILFNEIIPPMISSLESETENKHPYVVLYSYYIPCAGIEKVEYSCAEELANTARVNHEKYTMVVGYSEVHTDTKFDQAKKFMMDGLIRAFYSDNDQYTTLYQVPATFSELTAEYTFQNRMFECLLNTKFAECCTHEDSLDRSQLTAYVINMLMYTCTKNSKISGLLTEYNRYHVQKCVNEYTHNASCERCKDRTTKERIYVLDFCVLQSFEYATSIGKPTNGESMVSEWTPYIGAWKDIYKNFGDRYLTSSLMPVFCLKGTTSKNYCDIKALDYTRDIIQKLLNTSEKKDVRKMARTLDARYREGNNHRKKGRHFDHAK